MAMAGAIVLASCASPPAGRLVSVSDARYKWGIQRGDRVNRSRPPIVEIYQDHFSAALGQGRCQHFPSDSRIAGAVLRTCGALAGVPMLLARTLNEADSHWIARETLFVSGRNYHADFSPLCEP